MIVDSFNKGGCGDFSDVKTLAADPQYEGILKPTFQDKAWGELVAAAEVQVKSKPVCATFAIKRAAEQTSEIIAAAIFKDDDREAFDTVLKDAFRSYYFLEQRRPAQSDMVRLLESLNLLVSHGTGEINLKLKVMWDTIVRMATGEVDALSANSLKSELVVHFEDMKRRCSVSLKDACSNEDDWANVVKTAFKEAVEKLLATQDHLLKLTELFEKPAQFIVEIATALAASDGAMRSDSLEGQLLMQAFTTIKATISTHQERIVRDQLKQFEAAAGIAK
eukprot:6354187-Pyramimonas_sp.AAC.1